MREKIRILFIADETSPVLYDHFDRSRLDGIDLIVSCGDLPPQYLSFLATYIKGPVLYVHGNHDDCYAGTPPEGCECIDGKVYEYHGIRIAGLGGSMKYRETAVNQYTEKQMDKRVRKMMRRMKSAGGVDIFISHAPAAGLCDGEDLPHRGFQCFHRILDTFRPEVYAHGHVHMNYSYKQPRITEHGDTVVINAYEKYEWEL